MPTTNPARPISVRTLALRAGGAAALAVSAAHADEPDQPVRLGPLVVREWREAAAMPSAAHADLETDSPDLTKVFRQVPGLVAQESFGGFDPPRLAARGSGLQSAPSSRGLWISFRGMPINAADGSFNLALLEGGWLESAELIRGTAAGVPALGGALAFGGDPIGEGNRLSGSYGSHGSVALDARGSHSGETFEVAGRAAYAATGGWRPHSAQERESVFAASRFRLDERTDLTVQLLATSPWFEIPGPLTKFAALHTPTTPQAAVIRDRPRRETAYAQINARATRRWPDGSVSIACGAVGSHDAFYQLQANGVSETDGADAYFQLEAARDWGMADHHTEFSALLQSGWWDSSRYRNDAGEKGALIGDHRLRPLTLTTALGHRIDLAGDHHLGLGVSALTATRGLGDRFAGIAGSQPLVLDFHGTRVAPRVAWSWDLAADTTLTASWSRSYEPPTYNDLIHTEGPAAARVLRTADLDWQRADTFDLGIRGSHDRLAWSACLYYGLWRDEFLRLANADGSSRGTVNAGDTIHAGFESALEWDLYRQGGYSVTANLTYNYCDARFDEDPLYGNRHLAGVPPHTGWLGLRAVTPGGWFIAPGCDLREGSTYADHANNLAYGGSARWSLEIGRRHPDGWSLALGIGNLFDSADIASTSGVLDRAANPAATSIFLPAAGRTVSLRFEYAW